MVIDHRNPVGYTWKICKKGENWAMRKYITRTLTKATIEGYTINMVDGKPEVTGLDPVTAWGKLDEKSAQKAFEEAYGKDTKVVAGKVSYAEETYRISVDDFVAHATKVEYADTDSVEE